MTDNTQTKQSPASIDAVANQVELTATEKEDVAFLRQVVTTLTDLSEMKQLVKYIEKEGDDALKAKLGPLKKHYDGNLATLLHRRTRQHVESDAMAEVATKGDEEKQKFLQNPEEYLGKEEFRKRWMKAFETTATEAKALLGNLQQSVDQFKKAKQDGQGKRRIFARS